MNGIQNLSGKRGAKKDEAEKASDEVLRAEYVYQASVLVLYPIF